MAKQLSFIPKALQTFIEAQKIFFVGSADVDGRVNVSPKGMDSLKILDENRLIWLNLTGSGNETAAHTQAVNRITIMFCSFTAKPLILRLYGTVKCHHYGDAAFNELVTHFPDLSGKRQIFDVNVEMVQTSCGYAVPFYEFQGERTRLVESWDTRNSEEEMKAYWKEKNMVTIDGKPTGMKGGGV
jgi:hypothetical protein